MTGSSDGVIKLFRHYETNNDIEVVTAFRALPELIPSNRNAGLVLDWQQGQGKALVAGDVKVIRVWNAATEVCTNVRLLLILFEVELTNIDCRTFPRDLAPASLR
jgi:regulator-associated protein of mTOR